MLARLSFSVALATSVLFGTSALAGENDPLQIFVSKDTQSLVVYDGDRVVATSNVSTGKAGHTTPSGIFSILEKKKTHFSNLYDSAPMPYMQRLTWSGIALHESHHVPSYPASHGCVRMPRKFAKELYAMTRRGFHVVISDREVAPRVVDSERLFVPRYGQPEAELMSDADLRPSIDADGTVEVAMAESLPKLGATAVAQLPKEPEPVKILITRTAQKDRVLTVQKMLDRLGYDVGAIDGVYGKQMKAAIAAYQELHGQKPTGEMTREFITSLYKVMNHKEPTGWLYVRRNFKPVFDAPVEIRDPELALGTHFLLATNVNPAQNAVTWTGVTLDNHIPAKTAERLGIKRFAETADDNTVEKALERVDIPAELREKIETMLGSGSSITITDTGIEQETSLGTDFITITRRAPRA